MELLVRTLAAWGTRVECGGRADCFRMCPSRLAVAVSSADTAGLMKVIPRETVSERRGSVCNDKQLHLTGLTQSILLTHAMHPWVELAQVSVHGRSLTDPANRGSI